MELYELTVHELVDKLKKNEITSEDIVKSYSKRIAEKEKDVQAFVTTLTEEATKNAEEIQKVTNEFYKNFLPSCKFNLRELPELEYYHDGITDFLVPLED